MAHDSLAFRFAVRKTPSTRLAASSCIPGVTYVYGSIGRTQRGHRRSEGPSQNQITNLAAIGWRTSIHRD